MSSILGDYHNTTDDYHAFHCPNCNHRKRKLELEVTRGIWHCWICGEGGKNYFSFLKFIGAADHHFQELKAIVGTSKRVYKSEEDYHNSTCTLPKEYIPLWEVDHSNFFWRSAMNYLKGRGIGMGEIIKYGIGYCEYGLYENMIIIPSFDRAGNLNYFASRSFMPDPPIKFLNPPVRKNVVGFDLMINWEEKIILVESAFDAITIRRNAIPLFGKDIPEKLKIRIVETNVPMVNLCLDADAVSDAMAQVDFFLGNNIDVEVTELDGETDPSELGYEEIWKRIESATQFNEGQLFERKIKDKIHGKSKKNISRKRRSYSSLSTSQRISGSLR